MDTVASLSRMLLGILGVLMLLQDGNVSSQEIDGVEKSDMYCDTEIFRAECAVGEIILMRRALYGRMALGRCVETNMGFLGCHDNVIRMADRRCSGRRTCEIRVPDAEFEETRPCLKELKNYLDVAYICVQVETVANDYCEAHNEINITTTQGFLASTAMLHTPSCSGSSHPWTIVTQPGQKINLTLFDFSVRVSYNPLKDDEHDKEKKDLPNGAVEVPVGIDENENLAMCQEYGILEDPIATKTEAICGGNRRVSHVYLSKGNMIKLWITNSRAKYDTKYFIVEYQVIGCPDIDTNELTWFKPDPSGLTAEMGCVYSDITWDMTCEDFTWRGVIQNCTLPVVETPNEQRQNFPLTYGIAIVIIIGAALGVAFILFIIIFVRYRRRPRRRDLALNSCGGSGTLPVRLRVADYETKSLTLPAQTNRRMDDQTKIPNNGNPEESPCTPLCRYQSHPIKVNGNEYEHIWEAPLPVPNGGGGSKTDVTCTITTLPRHLPHAHAAALSFSTFKAPDVINGTESPVKENIMNNCNKPLYVSQRDIISDPNYRPNNSEHYSSLDKRLKMDDSLKTGSARTANV